MPQYPLDLTLYALQPAESYKDGFCFNEAWEVDSDDGRGELRRQAILLRVGADEDDIDGTIMNPATTTAVAAAFLGISQRHYHRLVDAGVLPQFPKGEVDLEIVETDFARHLNGHLPITVENPRTGGTYAYHRRKKVW